MESGWRVVGSGDVQVTVSLSLRVFRDIERVCRLCGLYSAVCCFYVAQAVVQLSSGQTDLIPWSWDGGSLPGLPSMSLGGCSSCLVNLGETLPPISSELDEIVHAITESRHPPGIHTTASTGTYIPYTHTFTFHTRPLGRSSHTESNSTDTKIIIAQ